MAVAALLIPFLSGAQTLGSWNCIDLNGTSDYVGIPHNSSQNPGTAFTVEAWIKADSYASNSWENTIVSKDTWSSVSEGWVIRCGANGKLSFNLALNNNNQWYEVLTSAVMSTGKWYHVAGTYDGSTMKLYLNGKQVGSLSQSGTITATTVDMKIGNIGRPSTSRYFDGQIDEVRVWNAALSEATLREYMCQYIDSTHPNYNKLVAYYNLDQGGGSSITDNSGHSQTGTNYGCGWTPSGAALGDQSVYLYPTSWSGQVLSLTHASGDSLYVSSVSGNPQGIHLYRVDNHPNYQSPPLGVIQFYDYRYWGVFPTSGSNVSFDLSYNYKYYPNISNKSKVSISHRDANNDSTWAGISMANDTSASLLTGQSMTKGEYILGQGDDLTDFDLVSPTGPTTLNVQGSSSATLDLLWTSSTVGGKSPANYNALLDYDTADFSSPLKTYLSSNSGADTTRSVSYQALVNMMNQMGMEYGDSLIAKWTAQAFAGPLSRLALSENELILKRGIISSDQIFNFYLDKPRNYDSIVVVDGVPGSSDLNWTRAKSTAGKNMTYSVILAGNSGTFSNPVATYNSNNNGADTALTLDHADLVTLLKGLNLQAGQVFLFKWIAKASLGTLEAFSSDSQYVYMSWAENPFSGISEVSLPSVSLFPNPTHSSIQILAGDEEIGSIVLKDLYGRAVMQCPGNGTDRQVLHLHGISMGTYLIEVAVKKGVFREKLIVE